MVFASNIFLFGFLPAFLLIYYLTPQAYRSIPILIGSYLFYAWWRVDFVFLFAGVTLWNYLIYKMIAESKDHARTWMRLGVTVDLLILGMFKYLNFGIESLNTVIGSVGGGEPFSALNIILPIGISFYMFQAVSFLIDIYRKDAPPPRNFLDFAAYISLFPQLIAGPILRYKDVAAQFQSRTHSLDMFAEGAYRFMIGFAQKILIADSVAPLADAAFALEHPTFIESWLGAFAFTIQLFYDFAGYSSMAVGLGLMMGFRFIENFLHPLVGRSPSESWKGWHISLSTWLRDYLYIPLGGNRRGTFKTYRNLFITMVLGGAWHGANGTFILWGLYHGFWLCVEKLLGIKFGVPITMTLIVISMVMFKANTLAQIGTMYKGMMGLNGVWITDLFSWQMTYEGLSFLALGWVLVFINAFWLDFRKPIEGSMAMRTDGYKKPLAATGACIIFVLALVKLASASYSPFLYFQF